MHDLNRLLSNFFHDESGQDLVEYAVVAASWQPRSGLPSSALVPDSPGPSDSTGQPSGSRPIWTLHDCISNRNCGPESISWEN
jgi:hypothetical protein